MGLPLTDAVRESRVKVRATNPTMTTWACYHCYGDPSFKLDSIGEVSRAEAPVGKGERSDAPIQVFRDLQDLIASLPPDDRMISQKSSSSVSKHPGRVTEKQRNVRVRGFLYAARKVSDDFTFIVGRAKRARPEMYMLTRVYGPVAQNFFGQNLPGRAYDFYDPPISVEVEGPLFFDAGHADGTRAGPSSLRENIPTLWQIRPVTKLELKEKKTMPALNRKKGVK